MPVDFLQRRQVQFAETDLAGVLHFSNYYRMMEEVECAFWRSLGVAVVHEQSTGRMSWPRVATSCEYYAPAHFEDELELSLHLVHVGDRSVGFEIEFRRGGERIALGRSTAVCCMMNDGSFRPVSIPDGIREKLRARLIVGDESVSSRHSGG